MSYRLARSRTAPAPTRASRVAPPRSVTEGPYTRHDHRNVAGARALDDRRRSPAAAGRSNRRHAPPPGAFDPMGERKVGIRRQDAGLRFVARPLARDLNGNHTRHLAGPHPYGRLAPGQNDRIRLDMLANSPREFQALELV